MIGFQGVATCPFCRVERWSKRGRESGHVSRVKLKNREESRGDIRIVLRNRGELDLDAVDTIDAVNEENQDEDEGDLQTVLQLRNDGVFRDKAEGYVNRQSYPWELSRSRQGAHT